MLEFPKYGFLPCYLVTPSDAEIWLIHNSDMVAFGFITISSFAYENTIVELLNKITF